MALVTRLALFCYFIYGANSLEKLKKKHSCRLSVFMFVTRTAAVTMLYMRHCTAVLGRLDTDRFVVKPQWQITMSSTDANLHNASF